MAGDTLCKSDLDKMEEENKGIPKRSPRNRTPRKGWRRRRARRRRKKHRGGSGGPHGEGTPENGGGVQFSSQVTPGPRVHKIEEGERAAGDFLRACLEIVKLWRDQNEARFGPFETKIGSLCSISRDLSNGTL